MSASVLLKDSTTAHTSKHLKKSALWDFILGVFATITLIILVRVYNNELVTFFNASSRPLSNFELYELILGLLFVGLFSIIFGYRRFADITRLNQHITSLAYYDSVTTLPNRTFAAERLAQLVAGSKRHSNKLGVLFIDFDRFKMVNDTYGHANGDLLIKAVGERLKSLLRKEDTIARLGGDEFLIIMNLDKTVNELNHLLIRLTEAQSLPYEIKNWETFINFSIGVAIYPKDGNSADELLMAADTAMYKAKEKGKGLFQFYSDILGKELANRYLLEVGLKRAMVDQQLNIVFQPILDVKTKRVCTYEVLLRWKFNGVQIDPELIVEIAEDTQCISELGNWVMIKAIQEAKEYLPNEANIAINISPTQFAQVSFVDTIFKTIEREGFAHERIILEVTESAFLGDFDDARKKISQLRRKGIKIAVDDFGKGHSSLGRLTELEVDSLKIDKSFVSKMSGSQSDYKVITAIIALAKQLNLTITAEGVETFEQMNLLFQFKCDQLQGFHIGRPVNSENIVAIDIQM